MAGSARVGWGRDCLLLPAAAAAALAIFLASLLLPLTSAVTNLYVFVVVLGLWIAWPPYTLTAGLVAIGLQAVDLARDWPGDASLDVAVNPLIRAGLIAGTAVLVGRYRHLQGRARGDLQDLIDVRRALNEAAIVATTDVSGRITSVNDKFTEISGYSRDELLGQDHRIINSGYHPKAFIRDLWRTIAGGRVWRGEIRNRRKTGEYYWVDTTIVPFLDARGKPYQYVAIRADITARKAAEEKLREQATLARVGQMAAVVAHEVKNPLAGIKGAMQILRSRRPAGDAETEVMDEIVERIDALNGLLQDLMLFARPRAVRRTPASLLRLAQEAVAMLREDPLAAGVDAAVEGDEVIARADGELVRAAIFNLLLNAAQAMDGRGDVRVSVGAEDDTCTITVRDSGPGIPPDVRAQVFEPFFTTKARGSGLGLAIARRSAEMHDGSLSLDCPADGGTVATLVLLLTPADAAPPLGRSDLG